MGNRHRLKPGTGRTPAHPPPGAATTTPPHSRTTPRGPGPADLTAQQDLAANNPPDLFLQNRPLHTSHLGRLLAALAVAVVAVLAGPAVPASAHTVSGAGGQDYETLLGPLAPAVPGVTVRVVENGSRLALRNTTGQQVVVLGYDAEPYLRVGPDGSSRTRCRRRRTSTGTGTAGRPAAA